MFRLIYILPPIPPPVLILIKAEACLSDLMSYLIFGAYLITLISPYPSSLHLKLSLIH